MEVDAFLAETLALTFWSWMDYSRVEPFGNYGQDLLQADLKALLANIHRGEKPPFKNSDFTQFSRRPRRLPTVEEMWEKFTGEKGS